MRTTLALLAVAALAGPAAADAVYRKPAGGDALELKAVEKFVEAVIADRAGAYTAAIDAYERANRISPHANTHYNIADLYRRMERYKDAIEQYRKYLELAPKAADRASVERLIDQLAALPGRVYVDGEDLDGVVFFDGKLVGPSPQLITIADTARHQIDRITPGGHESRTLVSRPMDTQHTRMTIYKKEPGNVVFSKSPALGGGGDLGLNLESGGRVSIPGRTTLAPGRHRLVHDRAGCPPVAFDAPAGREVAFVYLSPAGPVTKGECTPMVVTQVRVRFPQ